MTAVEGVVLNFVHMPEQRRGRKVDTELKRLGRDGVNASVVRLVNASGSAQPLKALKCTNWTLAGNTTAVRPVLMNARL